MKISKKYSHLNGEEWLLVHEKNTYLDVLELVNTFDLKRSTMTEQNTQSKSGIQPTTLDLDSDFHQLFIDSGWIPQSHSYYNAHEIDQLNLMARLSLVEQKNYLDELGVEAILDSTYLDQIKNRIAVTTYFNNNKSVAGNLYNNLFPFYKRYSIQVGIELLPTKAMQKEMSSGIAYYEGELHNILRHGLNNPPVPLVLIGLEP